MTSKPTTFTNPTDLVSAMRDDLVAFLRDHAPRALPLAELGYLDGPGLITDLHNHPAIREVQRRRDQVRRMRDAGFPTRALHAAETARIVDTVLPALALWDFEERSILVLSGPSGVGKTVAATWWALTRCTRPDVGYMRATTLAATSAEDDDAIDDHLYRGALVLDDLGVENPVDSPFVDLDELIDTYYADQRPLIITTRLTREEFGPRYGRRVADRLAEAGVWVQVEGASLRSPASTRA